MKIFDKLISLYSKITKRYIVVANKKYTTQYFKNGSIVRNPKIKEGDIIRGQRAKIPFFYDDFYSKEELEAMIRIKQ